MKCANCGVESSGRFCPGCGAQLKKSSCTECGAALAAGARFCTACGAAVGAGAAGRGKERQTGGTGGGGNPNLPWYIAGAVLLLLILILLVPMILDRDGGQASTQGPFVPGAMNGAAPGTPPPLTGTPREQADRLFNRIMTAREQGDSATARQFSPMAIDAYGMAEPLDLDGIYHLAAVHIVAGNYDVARTTAERILQEEPNHLLGLSAAAEAAHALGDTAAARSYYQRLIDAYDTESARPLQEYLDHSRQLPELRDTARRYTAS